MNSIDIQLFEHVISKRVKHASVMASNAAASLAREMHCPHCEKSVPKSTFYRHRSRFFDPVNAVWNGESPSVVLDAFDANSINSCKESGVEQESMELESGQQPSPTHSSKVNSITRVARNYDRGRC